MSGRRGARFSPPLGNRCCDRLLHRRGRHGSQARDLLCARRHRAVFAKSTHCRNHSGAGWPVHDAGRSESHRPLDGFLRGKRFLILDRDKKFTTEFRNLLEHAETDVMRLPHRSPNLNAYVERFVLSIKSECLDRMIFSVSHRCAVPSLSSSIIITESATIKGSGTRCSKRKNASAVLTGRCDVVSD